MKFRDVLRKHRQATGLTEPELADRAGVPLRALVRYGRGQGLPDWQTLVRLAGALGVPTGALTACDEVANAYGAKARRPRGLPGPQRMPKQNGKGRRRKGA
jgi:transcriptional regulator with XRE-family HTH domain